MNDIKYALRRLVRSPGFTLVAVASLALGIGANTAIFSIVNAVLIRNMPAQNPHQLVDVFTSEQGGYEYSTFSYPDYRDLRASTSDVFRDVGAREADVFTMAKADGTSEILWGELVTANLFPLLGVHAALGRTFLPQEDSTPGAHPVALISQAFWKRHYEQDPSAIGSTLRINGQVLTVVGVMQQGFTGQFPGFQMDVWVPLSMASALNLHGSDYLESRGERSLFPTARLRPGVTLKRAQAEVSTVAARLASSYPNTNEDRTMTLLPSSKVAFNPIVDRALVPLAALLMIVVGLVLAIACANLANLLLVRAASRSREIATRLAIGAGRGRLVRQLLTESVIVSLAGGVVGLGLAFILVRLITGFTPPLPIPLHLDIRPDGRVLAFTFLLSAGTGILFGLAPALRASRPSLLPALKDGAASELGRARRFGLRNALIVGQVAVSLLLLVTAGLFVRSLSRARNIDPGFDTKHLAIMTFNLSQVGYDTARSRVFYDNLLERARSLPGVRSVAMAGRVPVGLSIQMTEFQPEGVAEPANGKWPEYDYTRIDPGYFETMGVAIVRGRNFTDEDGTGGRNVVIISEAAARRFWPGQDPIGKRLRRGDDRPWLEVVGVAADTKVRTLGEDPRPYIYLPFGNSSRNFASIIVAAAGDPARLLPVLRAEVQAMDPAVTPFQEHTMQSQLALMLYPAHLGAILLATFGALALLLAVTGLYGVVSYAAARRTREVGIRMALGARPRDVTGMVVRDGAVLVAIGIVLGLGIAFAATRLLGRYLYGIGATDVVTFITIPAILAGVALLASYLPARRAAKVDPMRALRYE
jgi:predicted permease